jgi:hypothetical protein
VSTLFAPVAPIKEGSAALGWFVGATESGERRIFVRGNDDFGPNSLIHIYPDRDLVVIVLTHAGDKNEDISWSRAVVATIEGVLFGEPPGE